MSEESENQNPYEGQREDLFSFPEVGGFEEFGLVPQTKDGVSAEGIAETSATPEPVAEVKVGAAKANPPVPDSVSDLDEDLFGFDEIFSLEDDPFYNGTLTAEGKPTQPLPEPEPKPEPVAAAPAPETTEAPAPAPAPAAPEPVTANAEAVEPAPVADSPEPQPAAAPVAAKAIPQQAPPVAPLPATRQASQQAPVPDTEDLFAQVGAEAETPRPSLMGQATLARDRGPRILLPEDVPYSPAGDHGKLMWALVVCFLLINTGIFMLAHQASTNVNNSMTQATGLLAEALSQRGAPATYGSAPPSILPGVTHVIEATRPNDQGSQAKPEGDKPENWIDPRNYDSTHELAVGSAKALLVEGRFEDARRLLNNVLANRDRVPMDPKLREEIDYLIPLTYYEHGRSIAPASSESEDNR